MRRAVSSVAHTTARRTAAHIRVHMRTLNHTVKSETSSEGHFRFWHFVSAPACSSSGAANARNKAHPVAERQNRAISGAHSQQSVSSSVKYRTVRRRLLEEDEAKCKGSRRPGHRRTRGRAGGCVHADIATSCCSSSIDRRI